MAALIHVSACSTKPQPVPPPAPKPEPDINLGFTPVYFVYDKHQAKVWRDYGYALETCHQQYPYLSFPHETCARSAAIRSYREIQKNHGYYDKNLHQLAKAESAGFLAEYCWYYLQQPHWIKPRGLGLGKFAKWLKLAMPGHVANRAPGVFLLQPPQLTTHPLKAIKQAKVSPFNPGYPDRINELVFTSHTQYRDPQHGNKANYLAPNQGVLMDGYTYPLATHFDDSNRNRLVGSLYSAEKAALLKTAKQGNLANLKIMSETLIQVKILPNPMQNGLYQYRKGNQYYYRSIFLTWIGDRRIKVVFDSQIDSPHDKPKNHAAEAVAFIGWAMMESKSP